MLSLCDVCALLCVYFLHSAVKSEIIKFFVSDHTRGEEAYVSGKRKNINVSVSKRILWGPSIEIYHTLTNIYILYRDASLRTRTSIGAYAHLLHNSNYNSVERIACG